MHTRMRRKLTNVGFLEMAGKGSKGQGLSLSGVSLDRGGVRVLDEVSLTVFPGEVLGLIGPNGAGKSTLMDVISGVLAHDEGHLEWRGQSIAMFAASRRARLGISRTYQLVVPLRRMSVLENVMVGALYGRDRMSSTIKARARAMELLEVVGLAHRAHVVATDVSSGQQKMMDLARALAMNPSLLLMDEPLAALSKANQDITLSVVRTQAERGCSIILIEHVMRAVTEVAARTTVLVAGKVTSDGPTHEVLKSRHVVEAYLGSRAAESLDADPARDRS